MRAAYIYEFGGGKFNLDFYKTKSGKNVCYINARSYWVERLKEKLINTGGNYFVEKK